MRCRKTFCYSVFNNTSCSPLSPSLISWRWVQSAGRELSNSVSGEVLKTHPPCLGFGGCDNQERGGDIPVWRRTGIYLRSASQYLGFLIVWWHCKNHTESSRVFLLDVVVCWFFFVYLFGVFWLLWGFFGSFCCCFGVFFVCGCLFAFFFFSVYIRLFCVFKSFGGGIFSHCKDFLPLQVSPGLCWTQEDCFQF